jgi:hypothetical protein
MIKKNQFTFTLLLLSPLGEGVALYMDNFESPSPKDDLCQLWLELAIASSSGEQVENVKV